MKIEDIDLPEPLLSAQTEGRLVVFAGAGVSRGRPSGLPDFNKLADMISAGTLARPADEPIDQFLGELCAKGVKVHQRAAEITGNPASRPTRLHRALLSLFPSGGALRLVTTNFDRHFSSATPSLFPGTPFKVFYAPALPLGSDFDGIVHLHGGVDGAIMNLILTDSDFGRAYLTDGWATRFLLAMFQNYTTLFVGYSHNDPVMKYLARALPHTSKPRYALTTSDLDRRWRFLGINPVPYRVGKGPNPHFTVCRSVEKWSSLSRMGSLDHEHKIRDLVSLPPPIDLQTQDYLRHCLAELANLRFFVRHARGPDWLRWAESHLSAFAELFSPKTPPSDTVRLLSQWFSHNFVLDHTEEAIAVVERHKMGLSTDLWLSIATRLYGQPHPDAITFGKWVSILLELETLPGSEDELAMLLAACAYPDDKEASLLLFERLTHPHLKLKPYFNFLDGNPSKIDFDVSPPVETCLVDEAWSKYFRPNLTVMAEALLSIVERHVRRAQTLLLSSGKGKQYWEAFGSWRSAIEPHLQNDLRGTESVLIDAARDILEVFLTSNPDHASLLIESWSRSAIPLLERLSVHGICQSTMLADDKVKWLVGRNWLYRRAVKHEAFRLLKLAYPKSSLKTRSYLIGQVEEGPQGPEAAGMDENNKQYSVYTLMAWLSTADPACKLAAARVNSLRQAHPDWRLLDYPDFNAVILDGDPSGTSSPLSVDDLLSSDPSESVHFLACYDEESLHEPPREGLMQTLAAAASRDFDWSLKLATSLHNVRAFAPRDVWESLLAGWRTGQLNEQQWDAVLEFINSIDEAELCNSIADLMQQALKAKLDLSSLRLSGFEMLSDRLWNQCVADATETMKVSNDDWLGIAMNHPAGKIAEVWLALLSARRAQAEESWTGIPADYIKRLQGVVEADSPPAVQLARVVLASRIHFLWALDHAWTQKTVLRLLDWTIDETRAEQAWHGYLVWGRWIEGMLPALMPLFKQTFTHLGALPKDLRNSLCRFVAGIAIFSTIDPLKEGWLWAFIKVASADDLKNLASAIREELSSLKEDAATNLWQRWLRSYWTERITGVPAPLATGELEEMILWATDLSGVFPEVVEKICASAPPKLENTRLYRLLNERGFAEKNPTALARLLIHLLPNAAKPFWQCNDVESLVRSLLQTTVPHAGVHAVCDQLARLGCQGAPELAEHCK